MPRSWIRSLSCWLALGGAFAGACASPSEVDPTAAFVGDWSYEHPVVTSGLDVAQLDCPASASSPAISLPLPQIGWIALARTGPRSLSGTTDQGCTWSFSVDGDVASLSPEPQTCFNHNIGSSYTIDDWTLSLTSPTSVEESLHATSHQAVDCTFALDHGARRLAGSASGDVTTPFVGGWAYAPPDARGGNVAIVSCPGVAPSYAPQLGTLTIARVDDHTISVTTDAGCVSMLEVRDHTAELVMPAASCAAGPVPSFWSIETDGTQVFQTVSGTEDGCFFVLSNSSLTRSP